MFYWLKLCIIQKSEATYNLETISEVQHSSGWNRFDYSFFTGLNTVAIYQLIRVSKRTVQLAPAFRKTKT